MRNVRVRRWALVSPALVALGGLAIGLTACGGGSSTSSSGGSASTGGDEQYVATLCAGWATFAKSLGALMPKLVDAESEDATKKVAQEMVAPFETFASDMSKAKPPADVKSYHDQFVKALKSVSGELKNGKVDSAFYTAYLPKPSPEVKARLDRLAAANQDCQGAGFLP